MDNVIGLFKGESKMTQGKNTDSERIRNKKQCFMEAVECLPKCNNAVMMTGLTAIDAEALMESGKFGRNTRIVNYEKLNHPNWTVGIESQDDFEKAWNGRMDAIGVSKKRKILFKDILKSNLAEDTGCKHDLILVDACCSYNPTVAKWICSDDTLNSLRENSVIGINVNLMMGRIEGDSRAFMNSDYVLKMNGDYPDEEERYKNLRKMHIIANEILSLSKGRLALTMMMNYWDNPCSKMAYFFFKRINTWLDDDHYHYHEGYSPIAMSITIDGNPISVDGQTKSNFKNSCKFFIKAIEEIGEERIFALGLPGDKDNTFPFITKDASLLESKRQVRRTKNGFYVSTNLNNKDKKRKLDEIFGRLGLDAECVLEKKKKSR